MNLSVNGASGQGYIYPVLDVSEILQCMNELGIPFTNEDLAKPSSQRMQLVYEAFADIIMGVTKEHFDASVSACQGEAEHFDIYADSLGLMVFHQHLVRLMAEVGYNEFSIQDLIKPDPKRVRRILSAIINFAKFREERMSVYETFTQKTVSIALEGSRANDKERIP